MVRWMFFLLIGLFMMEGFAQRQYSYFPIHNYQNSTVMALKLRENAKIVMDAYGKTVSITNPGNLRLSYLFSGQELEKDLNLYFFPSRIYSSTKKRFFQVDPKSQYFSPYSMVGADPINYVDYTGNASKPLVLHDNNYTYPSGVEDAVPDLYAQAGDAYHVPLKDVVNGNIPDLPEFNGTIYINSHMGAASGGLVTLEESNFQDLKALGPNSKAFWEVNYDHYINGRPKFNTAIRGEDLGVKLREVADVKGLNVKTIVAGGCYGEEAAQSIGKGFTAKPSVSTGASPKAKLTTIGVDKNFAIQYSGDKSLARSGFGPAGGTRMYAVHKDQIAYPDGDKSVTPHKFEDMWVRDKNPVFEADGQFEEYDARGAEPQELTDFVREGRVPDSISPNFKTFTFEY